MARPGPNFGQTGPAHRVGPILPPLYKRHENGLKLSIRDRIVGFRLRNMDSMVGTVLTIEREIEDARSTRDAGVGSEREDQPSSSSWKRQKTSASHEFQDQG